MAKADLGIKRTCPNCGAKYYDLNRDPILCPKCGTQFETPSRARHVAPAVVDEEPEEVDAEAEFISLEEADEEAAGPGGEEDEDLEVADDAEDTFLEPEEEEDEDVADIIGDVDDEEN